jgi:hypothetical protein
MAGKLLHPEFMSAPSARTSFVFDVAVLRHAAVVLVCWLASLVTASAQVLITGEPGGSGAQGVMVSGNVISPRDFADLANVWGQYGYGLTDRVDIFAAYGAMRVFDETQHYVNIGSNVGILQRRRHGLDVSLLSNAALPMTHRDEASSVLVTIAVIASRPVSLGSLRMTTYGGFESLAPVGRRARGVFTPVETLHAGIIGVAIPLQKAWTAYVEYNPGPNLRSAGAGIALTIPNRPPAVQ